MHVKAIDRRETVHVSRDEDVCMSQSLVPYTLGSPVATIYDTRAVVLFKLTTAPTTTATP